ncbi:haloacid dehalogenase-like hydrolase [Chitinophaga horti]|uniref:Haloacid dehalogenase-like hydrolase n=1 Tax=Chitinophaga horti TaxID=2920382 RepID=A0ABY6J908_9BACT|nr:HAD family hydrolase [Chitinophaga horti]UYQ95062.1 haloacid dehalogenase-like hydrolase [Chitinophaga horti]
MKAIAFFDFDGTITTKDTLWEIIRFQKGTPALVAGWLVMAPVLVMFKLKLLSNQRTKELMLRYHFKGMPLTKFQQGCDAFCKEALPAMIRPGALQEIAQHKANGTRVIVVTASAENWVAPWCREMGIECIGSKLAVDNGNVSGMLVGLNCNGNEKVCRINATLDVKDYEKIYAYGDSSGDKDMLAIAHEANFRPFRG